MQNQEQYGEAESKLSNGRCKVCKVNERVGDSFSNTCSECYEAARQRKEKTAAQEKEWEEQHPILNTLKMVPGIIVVAFIGYGVVSSFTDTKPASTEYQDEQNYYKGNPCTGDCSGHEAGYDWAEEKNVRDASDCSGNSSSFIEGCESWVEEHTPDAQYDRS